MNKRVFLFSFFCIHFCSVAQISLEALRKGYCKVNSDSSACAKLFEQINKSTSANNINLAYKGAITAAMANHIKNKEQKLKLFKTGKNLMEQCILKDSLNSELRFLRFTIQTNCPKTLGYNKQIESDKNFIVADFAKINNSVLKIKMSDFLLQSKYLTEKEKERIKSEIK